MLLPFRPVICNVRAHDIVFELKLGAMHKYIFLGDVTI